MRVGTLLLVLGLFFLASSLAAQPANGTLVGEEQRTRDEIEAADRLAADGRFEDAVRRYQQILAESGDALVSLAPAEPRRALPARWLVHQRLASLPPEGRRVFNRVVEDVASRRLEQAAARRDVRLLEQIVADAFVTEAAAQALHLLGDLAFERGEFEVAHHYWSMLAQPVSELTEKPGNGPRSFTLRHPEPGDEALVQAKQILALVFRGEKTAANAELQAFRTKHPDAAGTLAGKNGKFGEILAALVESDQRFAPAGGSGDGQWPTFAGDASRNAHVPADVVPYWPAVPHWQFDLPGDPKAKQHRETDPPLGTGAAARSLAFFPVIAGGHVLVADAARIWAIDLVSGELAAEYDHRSTAGLPKSLDLRVPSRSDACYTLTVVGGRIYARFGAQPMAAPDSNAGPAEAESVIVCLTLERGADGKMKFRRRWQLRARQLDTDPVAIFEGTPLVAGGRMLVARTRFEGRQNITAIECYDADSGSLNEPPPQRWHQEVWNVEAPPDPPRQRHDLLTLAGPNVVFCTHRGAIVALDAASGRRAWAFRYTPAASNPPDGVLPRDLCPCLYAEGRVYAAPADADRIFCLDARTGEPVWESNPTHVVQLLGVARGRLFATLGGFPQGIRAFHAARGTVLWTRPETGNLGTFGRGLLSDRFIFWPTRSGLRVLRQEDGDPVYGGSSAEPLGHLALGEGSLVAATPTQVLGFIGPRHRLNQRQRDAEAAPSDAGTHYHLALARADAGDPAAALLGFNRAAELAGDHTWLYGRSLRDLCDQRRAELMETNAARQWEQGQKDAARSALRDLTEPALPLEQRVRGWLLRRLAGDMAFPDLIGETPARQHWVTRADGIPLRADDLLVGLLDAKGQAELERRATALLAKDINAAAEQWPWSRAVRSALLQDAQRLERENQPWEAARLYRQVLYGARWETDQTRAAADRRAAREGLIRLYSKAGYHAEARTLQHRIEQDRGDPRSKRDTLPPLVTPTPDLPMPWAGTRPIELEPFREWPLSPMLDPATGEEGPPADAEGRLFFGGSRRVTCRSWETGQRRWTRELNHDATHGAFFAETIIVAGPDGISRLRRSDGEPVWQFLAADPAPLPVKFPQPQLPLVEPETRPLRLSSFRIAGGRVLLRLGEQRLLALDIETGRSLWLYQPPGGSLRTAAEGAGIAEHYLATIDHILLQTTGGELIGLNAADGRMLYQRAAPVAWPGPPLLIDERTAVYAEGPTLRAIDLETATVRWYHSPRGWPSLTGAAPQLRRDGPHLLVATDRNYGSELERLRLDGGLHEFGPVSLGRERVDLARAALTTDSYVLPVGDRVISLDRDDGRRRWTLPLPRHTDESWRVRATRSALLIHPDEAMLRIEFDELMQRAVDELTWFPTLGRMQRAASMVVHGWSRRTFPLLVVSSGGQKLRQVALPAIGPRATVLLGQRGAIVVEGQMHLLQSR